MQAAYYGYKDTIKLLLGVGKIDVDAKDNHGFTPLMLAAYNGHTDTVELLLDTGEADVDARNNHQSTPLLLAAEDGHEGITEILLESGMVYQRKRRGWRYAIAVSGTGRASEHR